jgi:signal transduction histidine kinase
VKIRFGRKDVDPGLETGDWPGWLPFGSCAVIVITVAIATVQRFSGPNRVPTLIALGVAAAPFILDVIGYATDLKVGLPLPLFPVPVLIGMTYLTLHPLSADVSTFILVFLSAEMVSRTSERRWLGIASVVASCAVASLPDVAGITHGYSLWVIAIVFASLGGALIQLLTVRTMELRRAQEGLAEKAAADERSRIARELHDVIGHSMSVTMLHVTAARMALEQNDQSAALEALREAEQQGRSSMTDIRRTVGLLGSDGDGNAAPMPSVADLPKLVSDFRAAGLDVAIAVDGDYESIAPAAGLSVFRIVQESLTNAVKYAPGARAHVDLKVNGEEIRLLVHNADGHGASSADGSGLGIRGMMERASVLGGTLAAGPDGDGWSVLLVAPKSPA